MMKRIIIIIASIFIFVSCSAAGRINQQQSSGIQQTGESRIPLAPALTPKPSPSPTLKPSLSPTPKPGSNAAAPGKENKAEAFRFVVMGDCRGSDNGINSKIVKKTMEKVKLLSPQPQFAVMDGDLADGAKSYSGIKSQLQYFKKTITAYYPASFFYLGLGNHETANGSGGDRAFDNLFSEFKATFMDGYGRSVYYFDRGKTRLFMLNTDYPGETHKVSDKQLAWVKKNLNTTGRNLFFMHEPPFPTGANVGFSLDKDSLQRAKLWDLIDSSQDPLVFCSHEHNYTRRHINSAFNAKIKGIQFKYDKTVYQITSGGFGAPLYTQYTSKKNVDVPPIVEYNFLVVDMNDTGISVNAYNLEGKLLDSYVQKN